MASRFCPQRPASSPFPNGPPRVQPSGPGSLWQRLRRKPLAVAGATIIGAFLLMGLLAPLIAPHDPLEQNLERRMAPGLWVGNSTYPMGTDELGRDILSRILHGARVSLVIGVVAITLMNAVGVSVGLTSGHFGGLFDAIAMRVVDVLLSFPYIILAIGIMAVLGQGVVNAVFAISIVFTPTMARIVRGLALSLKTREYVHAAQALGASSGRVLGLHLLPNVMPQVVVFSALSLGETILYIAALGFLGLGVSPPTPEWGAMISSGKDMLILGIWWPSAFPGLAIMLATLGFVLLGDGLRDVLDPRLRS